MKFITRKYYSGFCTYEINAESENLAIEKVNELPIKYDEVMQTLEEWKECNEIEFVEDNNRHQ